MDDRLTGIKKMLRTLAEESMDQSGPHPTDDRLFSYYSKTLPADEMTQMENHLVACRECAKELLDLAAFCAPVDESSKLSPTESEDAWARFMARVEPSSATLHASQPSWSERLMAWFVPQAIVYALGALLLTVSLFLVVIYRENRTLVARLEQQNTPGPTAGEVALQREVEQARKERDDERVRSEQLEIKAAELLAQIDAARNANRESRNDPPLVRSIGQVVSVSVLSDKQRGSDEFESVGVKPGETFFTLHVFVPKRKAGRTYSFEIKDLNGKTILTRENLGIGPAGGLTIIVRTDSLPAGQYRLSVYEVRGRTTKLQGERLVDVHYD
jgi:hypothetical protein